MIYKGKVHTVTYHKGNFYILRMILDGDKSTVTVKGDVATPVQVGTWFPFEAEWIKDPKYGNQLQIKKAPVLESTWDIKSVMNLLPPQGVSEHLLWKIARRTGDDGFVSALSDVALLKNILVSEEDVECVVSKWARLQTYMKALNFMTEAGIPSNKILAIWSVFDSDSEKVVSNCPWQLVRVSGITFEQADEISRKLAVPQDAGHPNFSERVKWAIFASLHSITGTGHNYLTSGQIVDVVKSMVGPVESSHIANGLASLHKEKVVIVDRNFDKVAIYTPSSYLFESDSAKMLAQRLKYVPTQEYIDAISHTKGLSLVDSARKALEDWAQLSRLELSEDQKKGVLNGLVHPVSVLTGLPGTGKSTSLKAVVRILQDASVSFLLCAPTGIAAKRMEEVTGATAFTIHRAFGAKGGSSKNQNAYSGVKESGELVDSDSESTWESSPDNPYPASVVIVDESSMVDQHLMYRILSCTSPECRIMLVGDHAQLPSVGPGNVLRDIIQSECVPVVRLTEIFRQQDTSSIVYAAHSVVRGETPDTPTQGDFVLFPAETEERASEIVLAIANKLLLNRTKYQVMSPRHSGSAGVTNFNSILRSSINPGSSSLSEIKIGSEIIREDDRVMVVRNNYDKSVYNGDTGKINRINRVDKKVEVKIHGNPPLLVEFSYAEAASYLRLAYAVTVHKMQGQETDVVIIPVLDSYAHQLQRNLYYTAITRARKKVILVGQRHALTKAVLNSREDARNTLFVQRIRHFSG